MKLNKQIPLLLIILLIIPVAFFKSHGNASQNQGYVLRVPPDNVMLNFAEDPDFNYNREKVSIPFLDKFSMWLRDVILNLTGKVIKTDKELFFIIMKYLVSAVVILLAGFIILKFFRVNIFNRKNRTVKMPSVYEIEDITNIDFNLLLEQALKRKNYREVLRLSFNRCLKELNEKKLIDWKINKTNSEYIREINHRELKTDFTRLVDYFNLTWYGNAILREDEYINVIDQFNNFHEKVSES